MLHAGVKKIKKLSSRVCLKGELYVAVCMCVSVFEWLHVQGTVKVNEFINNKICMPISGIKEL